MFVYQNGQMYVESENSLVGVNITPSGVSKVDVKADYVDGEMLTLDEVYIRFGKDCMFVHPECSKSEEVGVKNDTTGENETPSKPRRGRPRRSV